MKRTITATVLLALAILLAAWAVSSPSVPVKDVRNAETIVIGGEEEDTPVHAISIQCAGHINGEAKIRLMMGGLEYKSEILKGEVTFDWGGDWYSNKAEIRYSPVDVQSGHLTISYRFYR